jgi:hypothetical protein
MEYAQVIALKISTYFRKGAKSLNYTLGPLLKMMLDKDPTGF